MKHLLIILSILLLSFPVIGQSNTKQWTNEELLMFLSSSKIGINEFTESDTLQVKSPFLVKTTKLWYILGSPNSQNSSILLLVLR